MSAKAKLSFYLYAIGVILFGIGYLLSLWFLFGFGILLMFVGYGTWKE